MHIFQCCACYGPEGGSANYCGRKCKAINGGTVTKKVFTWFWVRSNLPKRIWKKCMEYEVKGKDGELISYKFIGHSVLPIKVNIHYTHLLMLYTCVIIAVSVFREKAIIFHILYL